MDLSSLPLSVGKAAASLKGDNEQKIPTTIEQTERLFTTRSRSINYQTGGGDRGQHTFVQLLTQNKTNLVSNHTSSTGSKSTSLGTDSSGALADAVKGKYGEFLLTDIRVGFDEKMQVIETFGDAEIVYYFGRQPINVQFQGVLIDSPDNNWFVQFVEMYAYVFRGTAMARNYELMKIITPNMTFIGTLTHMDWSQNSARDVDIPFGFNMLVKEIIPNAVMVPGKPAPGGVTIGTDVGKAFRTQSDIFSLKTKANTILNTVQNPFSTIGDISGALTMNTPLSGGGKDYLGSLLPLSGNTGTSTGSALSISSLTGFGSHDSNPALLQGNSNSTTTTQVGIFSNVSSNLAGVRASLFSPVYGVLNSLTKLIKNVTGTINNVISSFTTPVRNILRDIRNISNQAVGIVNLINNSIDSVTNQIRGLDSDIKSTLVTLKHTAGVISNAPVTITSHLRALVNSGKMPATVGFLQNVSSGGLPSGGGHTTKIFLLNSGPKHTPEQGAKL